MKIDIRSLSEDKLCEFLVKKGFESYRGKQVYEWIWKKSSHTFANMTNISKDLRLMLDEILLLTILKLIKFKKALMGQLKTLLNYLMIIQLNRF